MKNCRSLLRQALLSAGLLITATAAAELIVIYDNGRSIALGPLLGPVQKNTVPQPQPQPQPAPAPNRRGVAKPVALLPIVSSGLSAGDVEEHALSVPFPGAFFMLGSDDRSMRWLLQHRERLLALEAVGLLVEASSLDDLERVAVIANGLKITPASGVDIAAALGVKHYPFAVTGGRIWQ